MKPISVLRCGFLLIANAAAYTLVTKVTPVQKVLQMMGEMKATAEKMMDHEAKVFRKYENWAVDQKRELGFEIKSGNSEIEKLTAFIEEATLDVTKLGKEIDGIEKEIERMETEMQEATKLRTKENDNYVKTQQDLSESVEAIRSAMEVVTSGAKDEAQAVMLLQEQAAKAPQIPLVLAAFLEEQELGAPKAAAYKSQSGGVLAMLKALGEKFKKELDECELEESNKAHAYNLELQHLTDTVNENKADLSEKQSEKGKRSAEAATAKGELQKAKDELAEDKKTLVEVTATFKTKESMFKENQKTRKDEMAAINEAIKTISSPEVSNTKRYGKSELVQVTSLLQTQSSKGRVAAKQRLSRFLDRRAQLLSSATLKSFANEVAGAPFAKVIDLIKTLIAKLKEEASSEAEHKKWCDDQLKANKLSRDKEGTKSDKLEASLEKLTGQIDTMTKEIATLSAEQAALTKSMSEATSTRSEEKASNEATIKEAVQGADALQHALNVLKEFYSSQSFVQEAQAPEMDKFKGQQGSAKGVIGMLEVIQSDFLRLKAETNADEKTAAKEYTKFMDEAKKNKAEKHDKEFKLKLNKDKAEFSKTQDSKDFKLTSERLDKANKYFSTLKPTCLEVHVSFEERAAKRKEEISALKEAYGILDAKSD